MPDELTTQFGGVTNPLQQLGMMLSIIGSGFQGRSSPLLPLVAEQRHAQRDQQLNAALQQQLQIAQEKYQQQQAQQTADTAGLGQFTNLLQEALRSQQGASTPPGIEEKPLAQTGFGNPTGVPTPRYLDPVAVQSVLQSSPTMRELFSKPEYQRYLQDTGLVVHPETVKRMAAQHFYEQSAPSMASLLSTIHGLPPDQLQTLQTVLQYLPPEQGIALGNMLTNRAIADIRGQNADTRAAHEAGTTPLGAARIESLKATANRANQSQKVPQLDQNVEAIAEQMRALTNDPPGIFSTGKTAQQKAEDLINRMQILAPAQAPLYMRAKKQVFGTPTAPTAPTVPTATGPNGEKLILQNGRWVPYGR